MSEGSCLVLRIARGCTLELSIRAEGVRLLYNVRLVSELRLGSSRETMRHVGIMSDWYENLNLRGVRKMKEFHADLSQGQLNFKGNELRKDVHHKALYPRLKYVILKELANVPKVVQLGDGVIM